MKNKMKKVKEKPMSEICPTCNHKFDMDAEMDRCRCGRVVAKAYRIIKKEPPIKNETRP